LNRWYTRQLLGMSRGVARLLLPALRSKIKVPIHEDAVHARVQQLFEEIDALREVLTDSQRTSVRLVLNPDHLSVQETQRAYTYMNLFGLNVDALFVNRILPDEVQDPFFKQWKDDQAAHRQLAHELFAPLPVFEVPLMQQEVVGMEKLLGLSQQLYGDRDAVQPLTTEQPLHFYMDGDRYMLSLRVTGVKADTVDLEKEGDQLRVKLGWFRRSLILPQYLAGKSPSWAQNRGGLSQGGLPGRLSALARPTCSAPFSPFDRRVLSVLGCNSSGYAREA
jgi:arsenite-transporting ATPase